MKENGLQRMGDRRRKIGWSIVRFLGVSLSAAIMAVNIKTFVRTGGLFPGGVTGMTLLLQQILQTFLHVDVPYSVINLTLNAVPVYIGFHYIGKNFTLLSLCQIVLCSVLTDLIPGFALTEDMLLIAVFGGLINGFAISICLWVDATSGGTDFLAIYLSNKLGVDSFNYILGLNAVILSFAGMIFGWDRALYSIFFQYASTTVLHLLYKKYQQGTLFIVTNLAPEVTKAISNISHHGATVLAGRGSYENEERSMVYSVVSEQEAAAVIAAVREVDPQAFINLIRTQQLSGRFYQKPHD